MESSSTLVVCVLDVIRGRSSFRFAEGESLPRSQRKSLPLDERVGSELPTHSRTNTVPDGRKPASPATAGRVVSTAARPPSWACRTSADTALENEHSRQLIQLAGRHRPSGPGRAARRIGGRPEDGPPVTPIHLRRRRGPLQIRSRPRKSFLMNQSLRT
jgi:hypothetical protein